MTGVLPQSRRALLAGARPDATVAQIERACLAYRGIVCQACGDICVPRAIRFGVRAGGPAWPVVLASLCNGCGDCAAVCPASAIRVPPRPEASAA